MTRVGLELRALVLVTAARILLRRRDTTSVLQRLAGKRGRPRDLSTDEVLAAVQRAGRIAGATCLPQSVALAAILQRAGRQPVLVLGCRLNENRQWGAHAWVVDGVEVLEPVPAPDHAELAQLLAANDWVPTPAG